MNVFLLLDILLLILIALFVPIGFWRGAIRESFVTLGILFGAALAEWWAGPWGQDLADVTNLRATAGAFMVAMLFLVGGTFLLGYSAGAVVPVYPSGMVARILGGLIAAGNGALLLSYSLRNIRVYLLTDQDAGFLDRAVVAHFLSTGVGWILMAGAIIFLPIMLVLALFGGTVEVADYDEDDEGFDAGYTPVSRRFPPRGAGIPDDTPSQPVYKAESPAVMRRATDETRPMAVIPGRSPGSLGGQRRDEETDEQPIIVRPPSNGQEDQPTVQARQVDDERAREELAAGRCPNCHADIRNAEVYCPRCGRVL